MRPNDYVDVKDLFEKEIIHMAKGLKNYVLTEEEKIRYSKFREDFNNGAIPKQLDPVIAPNYKNKPVGFSQASKGGYHLTDT